MYPARYLVGKGRKRRVSRWRSLSLPGWLLFLAVSCSGAMERAPFREESLQPAPEPVCFREAEFRFAMKKLENGDFEGSRETLIEIAERGENNDVAPRVAFALGVLQLLEMEDPARMTACRDYFQLFSYQHPGVAYGEYAERIVRVLDGHLERARQEQNRIRGLTQKVSDQEQVIQSLRYKIEKLEEIHQETQEKRYLF